MRGVSPGWHPDYDAPPGHQRFWNGERWTERRSVQAPLSKPARRVAGWVGSAVAGLVVVSAAVLVLTDDQPASSGSGALPPGPSGVQGQAEGAPEVRDVGQERRTWEVATALDGTTLRLVTGATVRLIGVTVGDDCATTGLADLVDGQRVTLIRRGPDKDSRGRLLRYVERDGIDVGLRLIQRGLAGASDEANPRRAIYHRVDDRGPAVC